MSDRRPSRHRTRHMPGWTASGINLGRCINGFHAVIANMLTGAVEHSFQDADGQAQQAPNTYCWNVTPFRRLVGRASAQIEINGMMMLSVMSGPQPAACWVR